MLLVSGEGLLHACISSILLNDKVVQVNSYLNTYARQNGWSILSNSNITTSHLNASGLHLNFSGTNILSSNFSKHINKH